jgi:hypothetical protein
MERERAERLLHWHQLPPRSPTRRSPLRAGFTTTFAGIAINHVPGFIAAQLVGAAIGALVAAMLFPIHRLHKKEAIAPGLGISS